MTAPDRPTADDALAQRFEDHRPHLRAVAYRMLGTLAEAEDVVQDAWLRASRAGATDVDNLGGWLTTIVARLCLDRLRTRASRREEPIDFAVRDPIVSGPGGVDPEQEALLADSIGLAMLIVLETLRPAERLAFVLHDTFGLPFDQIAPIVGRTPTATRQLASRARRRVRGATASTDVPLERQWELVDAFQAAAPAGAVAAL
jgi:RNA polymerase sigma factor (sigma-70 family)